MDIIEYYLATDNASIKYFRYALLAEKEIIIVFKVSSMSVDLFAIFWQMLPIMSVKSDMFIKKCGTYASIGDSFDIYE